MATVFDHSIGLMQSALILEPDAREWIKVEWILQIFFYIIYLVWGVNKQSYREKKNCILFSICYGSFYDGWIYLWILMRWRSVHFDVGQQFFLWSFKMFTKY